MLSSAEGLGTRDFSAHYCGQAAALGRSMTAFSLTRDLAADAQRYYETQVSLQP